MIETAKPVDLDVVEGDKTDEILYVKKLGHEIEKLKLNYDEVNSV
jgi:hypothetical protein